MRRLRQFVLGGMMMEEPTRPVALVDATTDTDLKSLATYLLADLGTRPIAVESLEALFHRRGFRIQPVPFLADIRAIVCPSQNVVLLPEDLTVDELRWDLTHVLHHLILDNAIEKGYVCARSAKTAAACHRADHGTKYVLAGTGYWPLSRIDQAAAQYGVTVEDLQEAVRDQI